jgi:hypothetical protein
LGWVHAFTPDGAKRFHEAQKGPSSAKQSEGGRSRSNELATQSAITPPVPHPEYEAHRPDGGTDDREDPYSIDANDVALRAGNRHTTQLRVDGGHGLDQERFDGIVDWLVSRARGVSGGCG